jgi:hypothetical protein
MLKCFYYDVIGKMENYIVINKFKKFIWKQTILDNFLTYRIFFWKLPKIEYDVNLWKHGPFQAIQKVHNFSLLRFF